jgi:hypothetical protein
MFTSILGGVLLALALLVGAAIVISLAMLAAVSVARADRATRGGIRPDLPAQPQPETDDARTLVLR